MLWKRCCRAWQTRNMMNSSGTARSNPMYTRIGSEGLSKCAVKVGSEYSSECLYFFGKHSMLDPDVERQCINQRGHWERIPTQLWEEHQTTLDASDAEEWRCLPIQVSIALLTHGIENPCILHSPAHSGETTFCSSQIATSLRFGAMTGLIKSGSDLSQHLRLEHGNTKTNA